MCSFSYVGILTLTSVEKICDKIRKVNILSMIIYVYIYPYIQEQELYLLLPIYSFVLIVLHQSQYNYIIIMYLRK